MQAKNYNIAYWKYFFVVMFSLAGDGVFLYAQGWYVLGISASKLSVGLTWCIYFLPSLFLLPIMGKLLDIKNTKTVLYIIEILKGLVILLFSLLLSFMPKIYLVYLMSALIGILFSVFFPSIYIVLKKIVDQKDVPKYSHILEVSMQLASILSVVATGFLYKKFGFLVLLNIAGVLTLAGGLILFTMNIAPNTNTSRSSFFSEYINFYTTFRKLFQREHKEKKIYMFGIFHQFSQNIILALNVPLLLYVYEAMKKGPFEYGILDGLIGTAAMIAGLYWSRNSDRSLRKSYVLFMPIISGIILILIPFINPHGITPYVVFYILFIFLTSSKIQCRAAIIKVTPVETMGQLTSFYQTTSYVIMLILALLVSYLCQYLQVKNVFLLVGLLILGFSYFLKWVYEDLDRAKIPLAPGYDFIEFQKDP